MGKLYFFTPVIEDMDSFTKKILYRSLHGGFLSRSTYLVAHLVASNLLISAGAMQQVRRSAANVTLAADGGGSTQTGVTAPNAQTRCSRGRI